MPWKPWQLDEPLMRGPEVVTIKDKLFRKYGWVRDKYPTIGECTDVYDQPVAAAVLEFQFRAGLKATPGPLGGGIADYATKVRLGVVQPAAPAAPPMTFFSVTGTWGAWNNGFGFDTGVRVDPKKFRHQPVGYNTAAFLAPDPSHSYLEARQEGAAELLRLSLPTHEPKVWSGYSMGADVVSYALNQWPKDRAGEIKAVLQFGDPSRPAGPTLLGPDPGGQGISDNRPPAWVLDRYYSFAEPADMYPCSSGLLPQLYQILVRAEASPEFAMYLFQMLLSSAGPLLLGTVASAVPGAGALSGILGMVTSGPLTQTSGPPNLFAMMLNIPAIIQTIMTALKFLITGAHGLYFTDGSVDRAVQIANSLA
jgi:hypothetical protein